VTDPEGKIGLSSSHVTVGNTAPELALSVEDGAIFNWGDAIPMSISVTDAEDGDDINCDRVNWTFGLGHNTHAHPEVTGTGCDFTIQTDANAVEHGEGEKIYGTRRARFRRRRARRPSSSSPRCSRPSGTTTPPASRSSTTPLPTPAPT
jgi:hypothetical protein